MNRRSPNMRNANYNRASSNRTNYNRSSSNSYNRNPGRDRYRNASSGATFADRSPRRSQNRIGYEKNIADKAFGKMGIETSITGKPVYRNDRNRYGNNPNVKRGLIAGSLLFIVGGTYKLVSGGINMTKDAINKRDLDSDYDMERPYPEEVIYQKQMSRVNNPDAVEYDEFDPSNNSNKYLKTIATKATHGVKTGTSFVTSRTKELLNNLKEEEINSEVKYTSIDMELEEVNTLNDTEQVRDFEGDLIGVVKNEQQEEHTEPEVQQPQKQSGRNIFVFGNSDSKVDLDDFIGDDELIGESLTPYQLGQRIEKGVYYEMDLKTNVLLNFQKRSSRNITVSELREKYKKARRYDGRAPVAESIVGFSAKSAEYDLAKIEGMSSNFAKVRFSIVNMTDNRIDLLDQDIQSGILIIRVQPEKEVKLKFVVNKF